MNWDAVGAAAEMLAAHAAVQRFAGFDDGELQPNTVEDDLGWREILQA